MTTKQQLLQATEDFFARHWSVPNCGGLEPPEWAEPWNLVGSMPNTDRQGTYAFLVRDEVIYIGVGARRGNSLYPGCGLGLRINDYTRVQHGGRRVPENVRPYRMVADCGEVDHIMTIGFDREYAYLAYALEVYLIRRLAPKRNHNKPGQ